MLDTSVPAYFVLLASAFSLAGYLAHRHARREGVDVGLVVDVGLLTFVAGVLGARLGHVVLDGQLAEYVRLCFEPERLVWPADDASACRAQHGIWHVDTATCHATRDCSAWARFWEGGLTYYGGLLAALAAGALFVRRRRGPVRRVADVAALVAPVGLCLGRIGCFLEGCCFGTPTHASWGAVYPAGSPTFRMQQQVGLVGDAAASSLPVHPTPLYEAAGSLALGAFLALWLAKRRRFDGQLMLVFLAGYSLLRFALEELRADPRGSLWGLSASQWLGLWIVAAVVWTWVRLRNRGGEPNDPTAPTSQP